MIDEEILESGVEPVVSTRGEVERAAKAYARDKIAHLQKLAPGPVLFAKVDLVAEGDPARERPSVAEAALDVNGQPVRAHVAAGTMFEAVDLLEARLRRRLEQIAERTRSERQRHREPREWHHGDLPTRRPAFFPRPVEDREVVRHKTFAVTAVTPDEAVFDMEMLDHDFYLFTNVETGQDNVVFRQEGDGFALIQPTPSTDTLEGCAEPIEASDIVPGRMPLEEAVELLNLGDEPFVFFVDAETERGNVVYRRYDGHYGLITPAD